MISNPRGPVVVVDPYSSGALYAPAFKQFGVSVIAVLSSSTPPEVYASSYRPEDFSQIIIADDDLLKVISQLKQLHPRCILPGCESGVELADILAAHVVKDVANLAEKATARRHKGDMATAVAQTGLPIIAQICTDNADSVEDWIKQENLGGFDLVIKPPKSASTDGVTKISNGIGWRNIFTNMLGTHNRLGILNDKLVVQQYVTGTEYVIDTFSYNGSHSISNICKYNKIDNGFYMAIYDSMEWVSPKIEVYDELVNYACKVLNAVGMRYGPAHIEIMLTEGGPRLIEIGARPHGGGHPNFCRIATGDSQIDRAVKYFTWQGYIPNSFDLICNVMVVFLICKTEGMVENVEILNKARDLCSHYFSLIHIKNNDWLIPTRDLFASLDLGFIILAHESYEQIVLDYKHIRELEQQLKFNPKTPKVRVDLN